jgi:integrase
VTTRLTDRGVAALKASPAVSVYTFDSVVSGLAVRTYPSGLKSFVFDFRDEQGRQKRITIGRFPVWSVGKARRHASSLRLKADAGEDVRPAKGDRIAVLIEQWRAVVKLTRRPGTAVQYGVAIDNHIVPTFGQLTAKDLGRNVVERWHGELAQATPIQANRSLGTLSAFCSWLEHDGRIERNPCRGIRRCVENQRQVYLGADEIPAAHAALAGDNHNPAAALALRLSLLTGCRIGEAIGLKPEQIDVAHKVWTKPASSTKQRKLHITPLAPQALEVALQLLALGVPDYESCKRAWQRARRAIGREDIRIHDLRHSRASALARGKASLPQIGRILGHTSPTTTQRYAHLVAVDLRDLVELD